MSRIAYLVLAVAVFALPGSGAGAAVRAAGHDAPAVTHGVVVGDVTARTRQCSWARADREGTLRVQLSGGRHDRLERLRSRRRRLHRAAPAEGAETRHHVHYRVGSKRGSFETAPEADDAERVRLAFGGDVAGQNVCRDAGEGFPIMDTIRASGRTSSSASAT